MKKLLLLFACCGAMSAANAQYNLATGVVTDCDGNPVAGFPVYIAIDSSVTSTYYFDVVYTDAGGAYWDSIPYSVTTGTPEPFTVAAYVGGPGGTIINYETPTSPFNVFVNNFQLDCDTLPEPPGYDTVFSLITGYVYDCEGNPLVNHWVYLSTDTFASPVYWTNAVWTDATGMYASMVPHPDSTAFSVIVTVPNPAPFSGSVSDTVYFSGFGDSLNLNLTTECNSCDVSFYSYWDSTGVSGNDTIYLVLNYETANPASSTIAWNYGDGNTGSGATTTHVFSSAGIYNICVTVTNPVDSCNATFCDSLEFVTRAESFVIKTIPVAALGVKKPKEISFNVYPNPANSLINITASDDDAISTMTLLDMSGRQVVSKNVSGIQNNFSLNLDNIDKGSYILVMYNQNNELIHTHTVIKQ